MKFSIVLAMANVASAHYFFNAVSGKGEKYVRASTRQTAYNPIKFSSNPAADIRDGSTIDGPDARCNQGAFTNAGKTDVLTVAAGEEVKVTLGVGATMQHPGPALAYMSRAPGDDVKAYDGSGDWFKVFEEGVCNQGAALTDSAWCTWDRNYVSAKVPKDTPDGEYLMRFEHIGVHRSHVNQPEHYVSCVQVKVTGGGSGTPGPMVKFPGAYKDSDDYANFNIYVSGGKQFPMPGPAVWNGGSSAAPAAPAAAAAPNTNSSDGSSDSAPPAAAAPAASNPPAGGNAGGNCAAKWAQCGGKMFNGANCCSAGKCEIINEWYSQCA